MKAKITFIADSGENIGMGHIYRCIAYAEMLCHHFKCSLYLDKSLEGFFDDKAHPFKSIKTCNMPALTVDKETESQILFFDGYRFDFKEILHLREMGYLCVYVDDLLLNKVYPFDLIINYTTPQHTTDYKKPLYARLALGLGYAPLRKEFREAIAFKQDHDTSNSVFVCFGGEDKDDLTLRVLMDLMVIKDVKLNRVIGVVGKAYRHWDRLKNKVKCLQSKIDIQLYKDLSSQKMSQLMKSADYFITSASVIGLEAACFGRNLLVVKTVDNQVNWFKNLTEKGLALGVEGSEIKQKKYNYRSLFEADPTLFFKVRNKYIKDPKEWIVRQFRRLIREKDLNIRPVLEQDVKIIFDWANEREVRENSVNQEPIDWVDHFNWFKSKLASQECCFYMVEENQQPVGQVRFDREQATWGVNFSIDVNFRGKNYSTAIIKKACEQLEKDVKATNVKAIVKEGNLASLYAFTNNDFKSIGSRIIKGEMYDQLEKKSYANK